MAKQRAGFRKATAINPQTLIIFSLPKCGKTEAFSKLEDHLIIDFDGGTKFFTCNPEDLYSNEENPIEMLKDYVKIKKKVADEVATNGKYKYIVLDTITSASLYLAKYIAIHKYNKEEGDNQPYSWDITSLAYGRGHTLLRDAVISIIKYFQKYCEYLIISGHIADKNVTKGSETMTIKEIDLAGKLKTILGLKVDGIGLLYRNAEKPNENIIDFRQGGGLTNGTRARHLRNKQLVFSTLLDDDTLETNWDKIYI